MESESFCPRRSRRWSGHPRVFNGARGGMRVEVVRGSCRVETSDAHGFLEIHVEPAGARLGVNVLLEGEARLAVYRVSAALQRVIELLPAGLRVPTQRSDQALRVLGKLSQGVEVNSKHLGADRNVEADATPCLRIAPHAGAWLVQAGVRPFGARGRFFLAGTGRPQISLYTSGERLLCVRDSAARTSAPLPAHQQLPDAAREQPGSRGSRLAGEARAAGTSTPRAPFVVSLESREGSEPCGARMAESDRCG